MMDAGDTAAKSDLSSQPFDLESLPTPIAEVGRRVNIVGHRASSDGFLATSYLAEAAIKAIGVAFYAGYRRTAREFAYRLGHALVRADGLGAWEGAIRDSVRLPHVSLLPAEFRDVVAWLTRKRTSSSGDDDIYQEAIATGRDLLTRLSPEVRHPNSQTVLDLIIALVQVRNKTKGHGAVSDDFYAECNSQYRRAVAPLLRCPIFEWIWLLVNRIDDQSAHVVMLTGTSPSGSELSLTRPDDLDGVYLRPPTADSAFRLYPLLQADRGANSFYFPNGGFAGSGDAEFIDYANGRTRSLDASAFLQPPTPLPKSETHGEERVDVQSNVFGNLPQVPSGYVERRTLQADLEERLLDKNHPIITLHGSGGVGKTSLALYIAHGLARRDLQLFDAIVWFSGRDVDLRATGPTPVRQAVIDLKSVIERYSEYFDIRCDEVEFGRILEQPDPTSGLGTLFIFDNFETMSDMVELHKFLDRHTHLPNKVLITSRERAFKADYPVEVRGMEFDEAREMMVALGASLEVESLLSDEAMRGIYDFSHGHAYVMRVLVGEIAKEGRYVPPKALIPRRDDIVDAVFERSFSKLSHAGRRCFLTVANWQAAVPELASIVVLGEQEIDAMSGLDECERLSLLNREYLADGTRAHSAPQLARVFARRKLVGDPERLIIREDIRMLQNFGVIGIERAARETEESFVRRFLVRTMSRAKKADPRVRARSEQILENVAELWPAAWVELARFRRAFGGSRESIEYALRRAVEEAPTKDAWIQRMEYAREVEDEDVAILSLIGAVEADPGDKELLLDAALRVTIYLRQRREAIPPARRGAYISPIRVPLDRFAGNLDASGLSRLAWLYLLENNRAQAWGYARQGLQLEPSNRVCRDIVESLRASGFRPRAA